MGVQALKKYFTPKWEEFSSHGELKDVLEASLASAIRASAMQMKVLGEFRTRMQEQRQLIAASSKSERSINRLWRGCRLPWTVLSLRKNLESSENSRKGAESEVARLMGENKEIEEKLEKVQAKLESAEAEFVANFHNTEAYTNFSDYFARVRQQEVLTALRKHHPNFDIGPLEARFPPLDVESDEDS
ncbi:hypothetical protein Adt_06793 [Abeliophyllum distichum]|uniref:Uncharacterized protein n=1 Tax=Abeliophyllum distichum TaxID=126358 RepID=A0ABD1V7X0_9LAMI